MDTPHMGHDFTQWCVGTHNKPPYIRKEQLMQSILSEHMRMKLELNQENLKARKCLEINKFLDTMPSQNY